MDLDYIVDSDFDKILITPVDNEDIVKNLESEYGIKKERMILPEDINSRLILEGVKEHRIVLISRQPKYTYFYFVFKKLIEENKVSNIRLLQCKHKISFDRVVQKKVLFLYMSFDILHLKDRCLLESLKKAVPNAESMLWLCDPCDDVQYDIPKIFDAYGNYDGLKKSFNYCYTYHLKDSERYGFVYYPLFYPRININKYYCEELYDVFFIGEAKHRYSLIKSIYQHLSRNGVRCHFFVGKAPDDDRIDGIHYISRYMNYEDTLREMNKCRCILDVCECGDETSQRYAEAVTFGKKLLVNDVGVEKKEYYNSRNIYVYDSADNIDIEWVYIDKMDYGYNGNLDTEYFLKNTVPWLNAFL